jgi:hypothetical protein
VLEDLSPRGFVVRRKEIFEADDAEILSREQLEERLQTFCIKAEVEEGESISDRM